MSREARALMLSLFFNNLTTQLADLEQTFARMLDATGSTVPASERPAAFRRTLKELEGSVLAIQNRMVRFSNPGVRDFLDRAIEDDCFLPSAVGVLSKYAELKQCWTILVRTSPQKRISAGLATIWSEAMGRMVAGSSGSALERLELVTETYNEIKAPALLEHVATAIADVDEANVDESEVDRCRAMIELSVLNLLPSEQAEDLHVAVSGAVARMLSDYGGLLSLDDVEAISDKLLKYGKDDADARAAVRAALVAQIDGIDNELDTIDTLDDLDEFESSMDRLMRKYGIVDGRLARDVEYRREAILEGRVRTYRGQYGSVHGGAPAETSNDDIRSMFRDLLR